NIYLSVYSTPRNTRFTGVSANSFIRWAASMRGSVIRRASRLKGETAGFVLGMLLGSADFVDEGLWLACAQTGIVHLLAVSGFHCALAALLARLCLGFLPFFRLRCVLTALLLWLYVAVTGFAPGAVRAGVCISMYLLGIACGRGATKPSYYLFLSGLGFLAADPAVLFDIGFQFSYLCALGLLVALPYALMPLKAALYKRRLNKVSYTIAAALCASACVAFAVFPFQTVYFNYCSPMGILLNPLLSALVTVLFYGGAAAVALWGAGAAGAAVAAPVSLYGDFTAWCIKSAARIAPLWVTGTPSPVFLVLWYGGVSLGFWLLARYYLYREAPDA
ncbi:MAG: ComEC/Rec2 family competence protein, partial [Abditibacteriota bacterium]|nr:ComEC/Rec2 family competence protein [Abditibacteriota bacterium]